MRRHDVGYNGLRKTKFKRCYQGELCDKSALLLAMFKKGPR